MNDITKRLFKELWWYSDENDYMTKFIEVLQEWVDWNKGKSLIKIIDAHDYGFGNGYIFVIHDNFGNSMHPIIEPISQFIDYVVNCLQEIDDENYVNEFWYNKLNSILNKI